MRIFSGFRRAVLRVVLMTALAAVMASTLATTATAAARASAGVAECKLPAMSPWLNEGFPTNYDIFLEPDGTLDAVMLFVDFPDAEIDDAPAGWRSVGAYLDLHQPGADWLRTASYGAVNLQITAVDEWYRMSRPSTSYGIDRGTTFDEHVAYIGEAVALADGDVDFSAYDIVYVVVAPNAFAISSSLAYTDASDSRVTVDGGAVSHAATFGTEVWLWADPYRHMVLAHETGHILGLPDLYAYSGDPTHRFVGGWDFMGAIDGPAPGPFAWHRWKLRWVTNRQVACLSEPGVYTVRLWSVSSPYRKKLAVIPTGPHTALVIESRRAKGLDAGACSRGVLVYAVDSAVSTGEGPIRVLDASPGDARVGTCADLDIATLGIGSRPSTLGDPASGVRVQVIERTRRTDVVTVTIP